MVRRSTAVVLRLLVPGWCLDSNAILALPACHWGVAALCAITILYEMVSIDPS
jgi:hypothetical protein